MPYRQIHPNTRLELQALQEVVRRREAALADAVQALYDRACNAVWFEDAPVAQVARDSGISRETAHKLVRTRPRPPVPASGLPDRGDDGVAQHSAGAPVMADVQ